MRKNLSGWLLSHAIILSAALPFIKNTALIKAIIPKMTKSFDKNPSALNPAVRNKMPKNIASAKKILFSCLTLFFCNLFFNIWGLTRNNTPIIIQNQPRSFANINTSKIIKTKAR